MQPASPTHHAQTQLLILSHSPARSHGFLTVVIPPASQLLLKEPKTHLGPSLFLTSLVILPWKYISNLCLPFAPALKSQSMSSMFFGPRRFPYSPLSRIPLAASVSSPKRTLLWPPTWWIPPSDPPRSLSNLSQCWRINSTNDKLQFIYLSVYLLCVMAGPL